MAESRLQSSLKIKINPLQTSFQDLKSPRALQFEHAKRSLSFAKLATLMEFMLRWPNKNSLLTYLFVTLQLSVVFVLLYGFCNWFAFQREHTFQLWMNWELAIPFLPWMILVYESLNLLTLLPLFTLSSEQMRALGKSLIVATGIAALVFIILPAPVGFIRTTDVGFWSPAFQTLYALDRTANTFPSLHITYSFLVVRSISATSRQLGHFLWIWFILICASVLMVHQHHVIDVAGGLLLAEFCYRRFYLKSNLDTKPVQNQAKDLEDSSRS